ncbi:MAG: hypothetical protein JWR26_61 [Pedosphaera sp.]|nr:hypothetical protein [Pedosphaera sp.]
MPIKTRMKKSGRKRVFDQNAEGIRGQLNQTARAINGGYHPEITPGPDGLRDPVIQKQTGQARAIVQQQRRHRNLSSLQRQNLAMYHKGPKRLTRQGMA